MLKPRLFIGSSTEGLAVAEAVQRNVWQGIEVTLWSQGVFKPSHGSLESILTLLDDQDFALFIFSPDDIVHMRGEANNAIRDNVLLELGIFIGRLGPERCYFLIPDGERLHIPTDLAGITPLFYESKRTDHNLVAATGAASGSVKVEVARLGVRHRQGSDTAGSVAPDSTPPGVGEISRAVVEIVAAPLISENGPPQTTENTADDAADEARWKWFVAYQEKQFKKAAELVEHRIETESDPSEKLELIAWHGRIVYRFDPRRGERLLLDAITASPNHPLAYLQLGYVLLQDGRTKDALETADRGLAAGVSGDEALGLRLQRADALSAESGAPAALKYLEGELLKAESVHPRLFLRVAKLNEDAGDFDAARRVLAQGILLFPAAEKLHERLAELLEKHFDKKLALIPRSALVELDPKNPTHLTLRANLYLEHELIDTAMRDYERANELAESRQGWILGNIGNVYQIVGLNTAAIQAFERSLALEPTSQYSHERIARSLDARSKEDAKLGEIEKEAREAMAVLRAADRVRSTSAAKDTPSTA